MSPAISSPASREAGAGSGSATRRRNPPKRGQRTSASVRPPTVPTRSLTAAPDHHVPDPAAVARDRLALLAERSRDVVFRYRLAPDQKFEYVSPSVADVVGWTAEELYADPSVADRFVLPEDAERLRSMLHDTGTLVDPMIVRWRHRDGREIWIELRLRPVLEAGEPVVIDGIARDIDDRIESHEQLRRSEERLRAMLETIDILAVAVDTDGTITFANPQLYAVTGWQPGSLLDRDWFETCVPDTERAPLREQWAAALAGGHPAIRFESGLLTAGGAIRQVNWSSAPILSAAGEPVGCVAMGDDVTAGREARALERRLTAAVEQTVESVVITDVDARILYVNPAFERVTGYRREEVIGTNPRILQSGRQDDDFYAAMWSRLRTGETWSGELVNLAKDGRPYIEEATITPIRDADGAITSYVAVKRDVTHERDVQARLDGAREERLQAARILAEFEPAATPEATASGIVAAVHALPDVDAAWIVTFEVDGGATLFAGTPDPFPGAFVGLPVPAARAEGMRLQASGAAWAEPWERQPGDGAFYEASIAAGISATAAAPIGNGVPIAVLRVGTTGPDGVGRLERHLPALSEFAAAARSMLEPALKARRIAAEGQARIRKIVEAGTFGQVFQPVVRLDIGTRVGFEALTRFEDGTRSDLVFDEARRLGLGAELEIACLNAAMAAAEQLPRAAWLSLNVSPSVLLRAELRDALAARSRPTILELTEHEPIADYAAVRSAIVALGPDVRIAVDDAGAGVANFSHLVELRPDFVKIDIGLVRSVNADLTRQALVVGLRHFAQATSRQVIAEGVETEAERRTLLSLGVELGQGFLFGRPAPAEAWSEAAPTIAKRRRG